MSAPEVSVEVADAVTRRLFGVGLTLASCATVAEGATAGRLRECIDELDTVIHDLRRAAFGPYHDDAGTLDLESVTSDLRGSLDHLAMLADSASVDEPSSVDLVEAAHCAQRVLLALERLNPT